MKLFKLSFLDLWRKNKIDVISYVEYVIGVSIYVCVDE